MNRNIYMIYFIIFLILFFLASGNYIIKMSMDKRISSKDVYIKENPQYYTVHIEVDRKQLKLIDRKNEEIVKSYPIATGKISSPTPLGTFKIVEKAKWGEGFGTRWMGINVPWGKYGIHGTNRPGTIGGNLSAGCIRMRNEDVEELYSLVDYNTLVLITNGIYGPMGQGYRELRPGDRGADVLEVQKRLKQNGYYDGALDGIYGEGMKAALIKHLKDNDISLTDRITANIYESLGIILME